MAQYIEHPALMGMRMGNQASAQRMQAYQQSVSQNAGAQIQAALDRQAAAMKLARDRDLMKAKINPMTGQPYVGQSPQDYGLEQEEYLVSQQGAAQGVNPQLEYGKPGYVTGPNMAPSMDVPFVRSDQLVAQGYNQVDPEQAYKIMYNAVPQPQVPEQQSPSVWETIGRWFGIGGAPTQPAETQAPLPPARPR